MILVVRPFLIVELIRHFYLHLSFNLRLVYLPSDVLHVHKKYKLNHGHRGLSWELRMILVWKCKGCLLGFAGEAAGWRTKRRA